MHDDERKVWNKKTIVDHLFPSLEFDENMNFINGERDLAKVEKVRKGKEKDVRKYEREHKALRMMSEKIWLDANHPTEGNDSKATGDRPRERKKQLSWKPYTSMCAGRKWYLGYSLQAHELLQKVPCDVRIQRKEKKKGYNKFETIFHQ
jgi:hypothetical protein